MFSNINLIRFTILHSLYTMHRDSTNVIIVECTSHPVNRYIAHKHSSLFKPDLILWYDGKTCRFVCKLVFSCLHMDAEANAAAVVCNSKQKEM